MLKFDIFKKNVFFFKWDKFVEKNYLSRLLLLLASISKFEALILGHSQGPDLKQYSEWF